LHSNVDPVSVDVYVKVAPEIGIVPLGPEVIAVSGTQPSLGANHWLVRVAALPLQASSFGLAKAA
jgi:hypothetical protein